MWRKYVLVALIAIAPELQSQQRGVVLTPSGQTIPRVTIRVRDRTTSAIVQTRYSDDNGEFEVDAFDPLRYSVSFSKAGYVGDERIRASAEMSNYSPRLAPQAVLGGVILDQHRDPIPGVGVYAYRYDRDGESFRLVQRRIEFSDDRGQYRIADLTSGHYYVVALKEPNTTEIKKNDPSELPVPTFYPGFRGRCRSTCSRARNGWISTSRCERRRHSTFEES